MRARANHSCSTATIQTVRRALTRLSRDPTTRRGLRGLQVSEQAIEGGCVGVMILPAGKVGDEVLANLSRRVFAGVGVEALSITKLVEFDKSNGKQHSSLLRDFALPRLCDFCIDPLARHAR
jgi:hypothetical protein